MIFCLIFLILTIASSVSGELKSFFFVTHSSYTTSTLTSAVIASAKISGSKASVTHQCRRNCALNSSCQAFHITLIKNTADLGTFTCSFFDRNACNWETTTLKSTPVSPTNQLFEKLNTQSVVKPKACVQYSAVIYKGNCQAYRGWPGFKGLDCDIAPRLCSDFQYSGWSSPLIWPWGFYGRSFYANCYYQYTRVFVNDCYGGYSVVGSIRASGFVYLTCYNKACVDATIALTDWPTISQLASVAPKKQFVVYESFSGGYAPHVFGGLEITPNGELSLNSTQENLPTVFPVPLNTASFVYPTTNSSCSAFWQFESNVSVCSQRSHLFNFGTFKWNGIVRQSWLSIMIA